jgi:hypothetical protein
MGIFMVRVLLFGHMTLRLCYCYLPNVESTWNTFKWKILDNSNYNDLYGGGDFSHVYVMMHKYFGKKPKIQKMNT